MRIWVVLLLGALPAFGQDALGDKLSALRAAAPDQRDEAVRAVVALQPESHVMIERLKAGIEVKPIASGWHLLDAVDESGVKRPYQLYVPESLEGKNDPVPLVVNMHGGVSRPEFIREVQRVGAGQLWLASAERVGFLCAFPMARQDCMWWSDAGVDHLRAVIRDVKRLAPVDDDRIVGSGFSDGGSGSFYLAMAAVDPFASFLPMNGHPAVASGASGKQVYLRNLRMTPLLVTMTQDDPLYPAATILPHLERAMRSGAKILTISYPTGGHTPAYFEAQRNTFEEFITATVREPHPDEIHWWCAEPGTGRFRWVEVLEIGPTPGDAEALPEDNVMSTPGRVRIGIYVDRAFEGEGVRVERIVEGSPAAEIGLQPGDIVVALDGSPVRGMSDLGPALSKKRFGDGFLVGIRRGEETKTFEGRFAEFKPEPIYKRTDPTARISVKVDGQTIGVVSRNVRRIRFHLPPELFGEEPVKVIVNGKEPPQKTLAVPVEELLRRYAREADKGRLFTREVVVELPAAEGKG
jgi:poly(3-hydroxybutyrate) depolymerase